jgi:hypothetical protein
VRHWSSLMLLGCPSLVMQCPVRLFLAGAARGRLGTSHSFVRLWGLVRVLISFEFRFILCFDFCLWDSQFVVQTRTCGLGSV